MYKLHMHTLFGLFSLEEINVWFITFTSVRDHTLYKLLWNKLKQNASKNHIFQRRAWSGQQTSVARRKEEALSSSGLDIKSL